MCGISGIVSFDGSAAPPWLKAGTERMLASMHHRGPDDMGINLGSEAALGAVRLAIRGLSGGRQPLVDPASGVVAVCNGEIDNHQELRVWLARRGRPVADSSDVAVVLPLYLEMGEDFVERLAGAFTVAVWDPRSHGLLLARDRAGERPLFYCRAGTGVAFASEVSALVGSGLVEAQADTEVLAHYLRYGYMVPGAGPLRGVESVRAGEIVRLQAAGAVRRRYWTWMREPVGIRPAADEVRFDQTLRAAVLRQSEVDVDFGVFLSGGLDSSLIAALLHDLRPGIRFNAYTLRFGEDSYDEGAAAEKVARVLGIESVPVWVRPEDFPATLPELIGLSGLPLADPAWVPTALLARRAREDVKLALVGEGADELFGGYPTYVGAQYAERYARWPAAFRHIARGAAQAWPTSDRKVSLSFLLKRFVQGDGLDALGRHRLWVSNIAPALLQRLGLPSREGEMGGAAEGELLDRLQAFDLEHSLAEGLLAKADRAGMSQSIELRAPFLDSAVMEFAAGLPPQERVSGWHSKVFLKRYALRYLPRDIVHRRKRGLSVPLAAWLRGPLLEWARARLGSEHLADVGLRPDAVLGLLEQHRLKRADHGRALWSLIVLSEWLDWQSGLKPDSSVDLGLPMVGCKSLEGAS